MSEAVDLTALAARGVNHVVLARGIVSSSGHGTDYTGWSDASSVLVEAKVELRDGSRGFARLVLTVEGSTDGSSWSTLDTFTFGSGGTAQSATVDSPDDHLRVSWSVEGGSEWQIISVTAAPSIVDAPGGGGGGGGSQTVKCVDLGVVTAADVAAGPVTLYTPGAGEIVTAVFATDVVPTDGPGIAVGRAVIFAQSGSRFEAWPQATIDNDVFHDSYGIAGKIPANLPLTSDPVFASGSSTVDASPATIWEANAAHAHLDVVFANGTYWLTDDEGNSGAVEPDWAGNAGDSVSDGDLTWGDTSVPPPSEGSLHVYAVVMTPAAP